MARAGRKVLVLERRPMLGGAAVTEELHPGFRYSRASYVFSLFRPTIVRELELERHGLKLHIRDPSSFTPLLDGRSLMLGRDAAHTRREIAKFSEKDAEAYEEYEAWLGRLVRVIAPYLDAPPFEPSTTFADMVSQVPPLYSAVSELLRQGEGVSELYELMTSPASRLLGRWFESEPLKATLATDAVVGAMIAPSMPGSGYVLLHHIMGEVQGRPGAWAYVEGGMGQVSESIGKAAIEAGASLRCNTVVQEIVAEGEGKDSRATGVRLSNGELLTADVVISNATPTVTFLKLLRREAMEDTFVKEVEQLDTISPVCKINVALDTLPNFSCMPTENGLPGPQHRGTIHLGSETCEDIEEAYRDAIHQQQPSRRPIIELTLPSSLDPTLAPSGKHVASLFCQYAPYSPGGGKWTDSIREKFANRVFSIVDEYCPGFSGSVLHADVLAPPDLERVFGLTGGSISHTAMTLDQLFFLRPVRGWARHRTPVMGLYMCGAGTHPGGGVMGAGGRNAAKICLADQ